MSCLNSTFHLTLGGDLTSTCEPTNVVRIEAEVVAVTKIGWEHTQLEWSRLAVM